MEPCGTNTIYTYTYIRHTSGNHFANNGSGAIQMNHFRGTSKKNPSSTSRSMASLWWSHQVLQDIIILFM